MVIDTSAIVALLLNEPEADDIEVALDDDPVRLLSAGSCLETAIVVEARLGEPGGRELDLLLHKARIEVVPVTLEQLDVARAAWRRFGRGRHQAGLNYGNCFAYALAMTTGEPLLSKGSDFERTDVPRVKPGRD